MAQLPVFGIFNMCTDVDACNWTLRLYPFSLRLQVTVRLRVCISTWLRKIPFCTRDLNPHRYCTWLLSQTLYQLSYLLPDFWFYLLKIDIWKWQNHGHEKHCYFGPSSVYQWGNEQGWHVRPKHQIHQVPTQFSALLWQRVNQHGQSSNLKQEKKKLFLCKHW